MVLKAIIWLQTRSSRLKNQQLGQTGFWWRNWATFINERSPGRTGEFMETLWKINFKLLKWLVWSSGLGRCVVAVETQVRTLRLAHYSNFLKLFFNSTLYSYLWTRFCEDKEIFTTQYFIAKHFIHLKEYIIVHTRNNNI